MRCIKSRTADGALVIRLVRELGDGFACDICNAEIAGADGISAKQSGLFESYLLCADCWENNKINVFYPAGHNMLEESRNWQ
jgi:hypothetical protein